MRKLTLAMTSVIIVCLISGFFSLRGQQQAPIWKYEVATPVIEDALTPQQREHSKLYERDERGDKIRDSLLKNQGGFSSFSTACAFLSLEPLPDLVTEQAEKADAVVIATFASKSSQLTQSGKSIFTDYELRVEEILKNVRTGAIKPDTTITVTRAGGKVLLFGHTASYTNLAFKPLMPGRRYLLFLTYLPSTNAYRAVNHDSSFDITDTRVESLNEGVSRGFARDLREFVTKVKTAISGQKEGKSQ